MYGDSWFFYAGGSKWREHLARSVFTLCPVGRLGQVCLMVQPLVFQVVFDAQRSSMFKE